MFLNGLNDNHYKRKRSRVFIKERERSLRFSVKTMREQYNYDFQSAV